MGRKLGVAGILLASSTATATGYVYAAPILQRRCTVTLSKKKVPLEHPLLIVNL